MGPNWAEVVQAIAGIVTLMVAIGGIYFVQQQIGQVERTIRDTTHERLTTESFDVLRFLSSVPGSYAYFYERKPVEPDSQNREQILYATEMLVNYMEHVVLQKPSMKPTDWATWEHFIRDTCAKAPVVCSHLERHSEWYTADLIRMAKEATGSTTASAPRKS